MLASIRGAAGTPDQRDAQITRSGMYAEYPAIISAYLELCEASDDLPTRVEALKRTVFLVWHSFSAPSVDTGISELAESVVRDVMRVLDRALAKGEGDDELRMMLAWYRDQFGYPFEYFGPVRALDPFIRDVTSAEARRTIAVSALKGRGQLGAYWSAVAAGA